MKCTEKTGAVVGAAAVSDEDQLMLMTSGGQSIRIRVDEVRETGRNAQGVKLLSLTGDERLQDIAPVVEEEAVELPGQDSSDAVSEVPDTPESGDDAEGGDAPADQD